MVVVAAIEQFALGMGKVEEWCFIRLYIAQRHNVEIDIGDLTPAVRHFVTQDTFRLNPVVFGRFPHDHQQVIDHGVAMACAADQFPEQQDIFGIEIAVRQSLDDSSSFGRIVKSFGGLFEFEDYTLYRGFLHGVLIRFHVIDC